MKVGPFDVAGEIRMLLKSVRLGSARWEIALALLVAFTTVAVAQDGRVCEGIQEKLTGGTAAPSQIVVKGTRDRLLSCDGRRWQIPARDFVCGWMADDQCRLEAHEQVIDDDDDATEQEWVCGLLYMPRDKGYSWLSSSMPARITSSDVDATATMWAFFHQCHARQPEQSGGHP